MYVKNYYQCCAVPCCRNTTIKTPTKLFIHVPAKKDIRNKWLTLARVNTRDVSAKSNLFFCEDHFDLPNDMENYMEYHLLGSVKRVLMKPTCLPSKFECQLDRKKRTITTFRDVYIKRQRKQLVESLLRDEKELKMEGASRNSTHLSRSSNTEQHTPPNIQCALEEIAESWNISDIINIIVTDNGRNIMKAVNASPFVGKTCFIHTLQHAIQDALEA